MADRICVTSLIEVYSTRRRQRELPDGRVGIISPEHMKGANPLPNKHANSAIETHGNHNWEEIFLSDAPAKRLCRQGNLGRQLIRR